MAVKTSFAMLQDYLMVMVASGRVTRSSLRSPSTTARVKTVQKTLKWLAVEAAVAVAAAGAADVAREMTGAGHVVAAGAEAAVVAEVEAEAQSRAQALVRCFAGTERKASASSSLMMAVRISSATFLA